MNKQSAVSESAQHLPSLCPFCAADVAPGPLGEDHGRCSACAATWERKGRTLFWRPLGPPAGQQEVSAAGVSGSRWRRAVDNPRLVMQYVVAKLGMLHPLSGKCSPLAAFMRWRINNYYRATLDDRALAREWAEAFTAGLELPDGGLVLDHGCGRGRMAALATSNGLRVCGQEIEAHGWWDRIDFAALQVVPPGAPHLPWSNEMFSLMLDIGVIGHFDPPALAGLASEAHRVLRPGGYWVILEANSEGYGAAGPRQHYGRLHSLEEVKRIASAAGFSVVDVEYEGFRSPVLPVLVNLFRTFLWPGRFDISDRRSLIPRLIAPRKRYLWRLRLRRDGNG